MRTFTTLVVAAMALGTQAAFADDAAALREAQDRAAIEALMWRYVRALDSMDADGYAAVFTEDGKFKSGSTQHQGRAEMKEMIAGKLNQRLRGEIVKNIFFIIGRIDAPAEATQSPQPAAEAANKIDDTFLDGVDDPEIRSVFKQLLKSYSRRPPKV